MKPLSRWALTLLLVLAALATGCKKQGPDSAAAAKTPRTPGAPQATAYTPVAIAAADSDLTATLNQLSSELHKYVLSTRSVPRNFEEFVAKSRLQVPPAPTGKKYVIQNHAVVLVKR